MINRIWKNLKRWRTIRLGPIALHFKFHKSVRVAPNSRARLNASRLRHNAWVSDRPVQSSAATPQVSSADAPPKPEAPEIAIVVGVGPGFGHALAWRLARDGFAVVLASRNTERLDHLVRQIELTGGTAFAYACDATDEQSTAELFRIVQANHGIPNLVVYSLQSFAPGVAVEIELPAFEESWRHNCLGAFLIARQASRSMLAVGRGSIVFVGSTSSLIGRAGHLNLAVGKFGQRALSQVLARELWPKGIHVAHMIVDADIHEGELRDDGGPQADPNDIASFLLAVHRQPRSAWTSEVDIRPSDESFWEHC